MQGRKKQEATVKVSGIRHLKAFILPKKESCDL